MRTIFALLLIVTLVTATTVPASAIGVVLSDKMYTAAKYSKGRGHIGVKKVKSATPSRSKPAKTLDKKTATAEQHEEVDKREQTAAK